MKRFFGLAKRRRPYSREVLANLIYGPLRGPAPDMRVAPGCIARHPTCVAPWT